MQVDSQCKRRGKLRALGDVILAERKRREWTMERATEACSSVGEELGKNWYERLESGARRSVEIWELEVLEEAMGIEWEELVRLSKEKV